MSLYVIREKVTGQFCMGERLRRFSQNLDESAFYKNRKNAEKAVKDLNKSFAPTGDYGPRCCWWITNDDGNFSERIACDANAYATQLKNHWEKSSPLSDHQRQMIDHYASIPEMHPTLEVVEIGLTVL